jgi:hypothetical protein
MRPAYDRAWRVTPLCVRMTHVCVDATLSCVHYAQMQKTRKLSASDVCHVTGYNRDQLRALLKELPDWSAAPAERMAREFSPHDLIVLSVVRTLDAVIGMRRKAIASLLPKLQSTLSGPKVVSAGAILVISFDPLRVEYMHSRNSIAEGLMVPLQPIFDRVDYYLGVGHTPSSSSQTNLRLGVTLVRGRRRRGSAQ